MLHSVIKSFKIHFGLLFFFILIRTFGVFVEVQSELICSHQPIIAAVGDDVILPCHLELALSAGLMTVEWAKPGLHPKYVQVHQDGRLLYEVQNPSYHYRTRLFVDELMSGNVSLKLYKVKPSDEGKYWCLLPLVEKEALITLIVSSISTPVIEVISNTSGRLVIQCESKGWYPEPELLWLDAEGKILSAGPTETVRGPDDLYTVSSRVTVEKRHSNNITCRVQQKKSNQTRETQIYISDGFLVVQSSPDRFWSIIMNACYKALCFSLLLLLGQRTSK
uniref:Ig-like domain-containing protein n=1 Tax=Anabas testudineus TaxID=64144 RepID=A0A7N6C0U1_ANATE